MRSKPVTSQIYLGGSGTNISNLSQEILTNIVVCVPLIEEQRRIAHILATWDQAIAAAECILDNSRKQRQVLTNLLLSGKRRLGKHGAWRTTKLSRLITESRVSGSGGHTARKLTVKLYGRGVVGKSEKRMGSESTQYYRRKAGQFVYSKLDFLNGAFGCVPAHLDGYESTLDLPAFDFLPGVDPRWFLYFVCSEEFYRGHLGLANGGRKARRVNPKDLLRVDIQLPELEEQQLIANLLDSAQAEVLNYSGQLEKLRQEKTTLMAQLLTGNCRVRLPAEEALT